MIIFLQDKDRSGLTKSGCEQATEWSTEGTALRQSEQNGPLAGAQIGKLCSHIECDLAGWTARSATSRSAEYFRAPPVHATTMVSLLAFPRELIVQ